MFVKYAVMFMTLSRAIQTQE